MNKQTELKMLNNRIYGRSFGKGNDNDVGVEWNTVLKLIEEAKKEVFDDVIKEHKKHNFTMGTTIINELKKKHLQNVTNKGKK